MKKLLVTEEWFGERCKNESKLAYTAVTVGFPTVDINNILCRFSSFWEWGAKEWCEQNELSRSGWERFWKLGARDTLNEKTPTTSVFEFTSIIAADIVGILRVFQNVERKSSRTLGAVEIADFDEILAKYSIYFDWAPLNSDENKVTQFRNT